jgi:hypothetical protein
MCTSPVGARKSSLRVFLSPDPHSRKAPRMIHRSFPALDLQTAGIPIAQLPSPAQKSRDKPPEML